MKFPLYVQTTEYTCGPAAAMMVLRKLGRIKKMDKETEFTLLESIHHSPFVISLPFGMARALAKRGVRATIIRETESAQKSEFDVCFKYETPKAPKQEYLRFFKKTGEVQRNEALNSGVKFAKYKPSAELVKSLLQKKKIVLALIDANYFPKYLKKHKNIKHTPHWIVMYEYKNGFLVNDPAGGRIILSEKELANSMNLLYKKFKMKPALVFVNKR